jgi:hypothetical protein
MRTCFRSIVALCAVVLVTSATFCQGLPRFEHPARFLDQGFAEFVTGDFDGDGRVDVVLHGIEDLGVPGSVDGLIHLRNDGFGNFALVATHDLGTSITALRVTDLDQDGRSEVSFCVSGSAAPGFHTFANYEANGSGAIVPMFVATAGFSSNVLSAGDVNADGRIDVVTEWSFFPTPALVVSLRDPSGAYPAVPGTFPVVSTVDALELVDVANDGILDYAVADGDPNGVIRVYRGDGAGSKTITQNSNGFAGAKSVSRLLVGDLDGDGAADVVTVSEPSQPGLHRNLPLGLAAGVQLAPNFTGTIGAAALVDIDEDGDLDLIGSRLTSATQATSAIQLTNDGFGTCTEAAQAPTGPFVEAAAADVDGDGDVDLLARSVQRSLWTVRREGAGWVAGTDSVEIQGTYIASCAGDFDGDGDRDVVRASPQKGEFRMFANQGNADLTSGPVVTGAASVFTLEAADVNADGKSDLVFLTWPNKTLNVKLGAVGGFGATQSYATSASLGSPDALAIGDLDGDGDIDAVTASVAPATGLTVMKNAAGAFTAIQSLAAPIEPLDLELGDVSGDGIPDLVAVRGSENSGNSISIFVGTGSGFLAPIEIGPVPYGYPDEVELGDLNGDGRADLVVTGVLSSTSAYAYVASYVFGAGWAGSWSADTRLPPLTRSLRCVDVDGDGQRDAVIASSSARAVAVAFGIGNGSFEEPEASHVNGDATFIDVANYDTDSDLEIAAVRHYYTAIAIVQPRCRGAAAKFGNACAGDGGFVPELTVQGCFGSGSNVTFEIERARGGGPAVLLFGLTPTPQLFSTSCVLHIGALLPTSIVLPLSGSGAGNGSLTLPATLPSLTSGLTFTMQAACADSTLPWGYTTTNALEVIAD